MGLKRANIAMVTLLQLLAVTILMTNAVDATIDDWSMFHHDLSHTGNSASTIVNNVLNWTFLSGDEIRSSPAVANGYVYIGSYDNKIYCLYASNGTIKWSYMTGNSVWSSPAVADGRVYIGSDDNNVYCLNAENGNLIWNYTTSGSIHSSPAVADGRVYVGSDDNNVYCLNAEGNGDGTTNKTWNYTTSGSIHSSPAISDGYVYVGSYDNKIYCLYASNGTIKWSYMTGNSVWSSPAISDGYVYVGSTDDKVYCLHASNGTEKWSYTTDNTVLSSPAISDGYVYVGSSDKKMYCLHASNGTKKWSYTTDNLVRSSPAIANGHVYFGCHDKKLYCLDTDGNFKWSSILNDQIRSSPAIVDGFLYIGCKSKYGGQVYCFGGYNEPPETPEQPDGSTNGYANEEYTYTTNVVYDPDGDDIAYMFDWGDGNDSGWVSSPSASYAWSVAGTYDVTVKAKDIHGAESDWSEVFTVIITAPLPGLLISCQPSVVEGKSFNVTITSDGTSVEDVNVTFNDETKTTDSDGQVIFTAPEVTENTEYIITATLEGYLENTATITVLNQKEQKGWIYGVISDKFGSLLGGISVCARISEDITSTCVFTDEKGIYVTSVSAGMYTVEASENGYETSIKTITVDENNAYEMNFVLEKLTDDSQIESESAEKQAMEYLIDTEIEKGTIDGKLVFEKGTNYVQIYNEQLDIVINEYIKPEKITLSIDADDISSKIIAIQLGPGSLSDLTNLEVLYDGDTVSEVGFNEIFTSENEDSDPKWTGILVTDVTGKQTLYMLFYIPYFSEHTITISTIIETVAYTLSILLYIVCTMIAIVVIFIPKIQKLYRIKKRLRKHKDLEETD